ncbi:hypothetical protein ACQR3P_01840 [Rhodococcus sp. IEGM1300]
MPNTNICSFTPPSRSFTYIEAHTAEEKKRFVLDATNKILYVLQATHNTTAPLFELKPLSMHAARTMGIRCVDRMIHCTTEMTKNPNLTGTIIAQFNSSTSIPNRFRAITDLNSSERTHYKQLSNLDQTQTLRLNLTSLIDHDLRPQVELILKEWETFGVSASEVDMPSYIAFKPFYDEVMACHAVVKPDYSKVDFATQNIKPDITDPRCLDAKLTPLQLFKAAFQLGDIPAVSNFRFMDNPASKDDGKYREWMFHVDNSNYAAEFKLITTRITGTLESNTEQCLAAFPYETHQTIRFTSSEAATKFPTLENLEQEFRDVPGARYIVIKNPDSNTPIETGIRTEMIAHHRSASNKDGLDTGESRSAELMTFHGLERCQPFLSPQELETAGHLSPLQNFVLGGFRASTPEKFMEFMTLEKGALNSQIRDLIDRNSVKALDSITAALFNSSGNVVKNPALFEKQMNTYDKLPQVIEQIPRLIQDSAWRKDTVLEIVPLLMNFDQNAELKPDCSENKAFPARTQIRERTNEAFHGPLRRDLEQVVFSSRPNYLLTMDTLIKTVSNLHDFYEDHTAQLKIASPENKNINLFNSRAALANEYISQLPLRATLPETHQTLLLFIYYMIDDLAGVTQLLSDSNVDIDLTQLNSINLAKPMILQHFITHRLLNDSLID